MIKSKNDYLLYLSEDLKHSLMDKYTIADYFRCDILRYQRRMRKIEYLINCHSKNIALKVYCVLLRGLNHKLALRLGFLLPLHVFGPGLYIAHYGTIVVSHKSKIGKNCIIHANTNIGDYHGAPVLGDNVYIGPGAKLFGNIRIGNNVAIGANSVVNKSFPDNVTIGGVPAKIISQKSSIEQGLYPKWFSGVV